MAGLNLVDARCEALFVSALQRGGPVPVLREAVRDAIQQAIRDFGVRGCAAQVAQEFGDHPDTAVMRMRWARHVVTQAFTAGTADALAASAEPVGWSSRAA